MSAKNDLLIKYLFELVVVRETRSLSIFEIISQRLTFPSRIQFSFQPAFCPGRKQYAAGVAR